MTLDLNPGDDLARVGDGLETVTLNRPGSSAATVVAAALRSRVHDRQAAESAGRYTSSDTAWHLPASELSDPPQVGDVIVDAAGRRWTLLFVEQTSLGSRWRCVARDLAVAHGLDAYVDVEKCVPAKGQGGAAAQTWKTWKTGLRARVQPAGSEVGREHDRRVTRARFTIYLARDIDLDRTHRLRGSDGTVYRVLGVRKADRVDALMEIDAVRTDPAGALR